MTDDEPMLHAVGDKTALIEKLLERGGHHAPVARLVAAVSDPMAKWMQDENRRHTEPSAAILAIVQILGSAIASIVVQSKVTTSDRAAIAEIGASLIAHLEKCVAAFRTVLGFPAQVGEPANDDTLRAANVEYSSDELVALLLGRGGAANDALARLIAAIATPRHRWMVDEIERSTAKEHLIVAILDEAARSIAATLAIDGVLTPNQTAEGAGVIGEQFTSMLREMLLSVGGTS